VPLRHFCQGGANSEKIISTEERERGGRSQRILSLTWNPSFKNIVTDDPRVAGLCIYIQMAPHAVSRSVTLGIFPSPFLILNFSKKKNQGRADALLSLPSGIHGQIAPKESSQ
jgi:hypothetical protein